MTHIWILLFIIQLFVYEYKCNAHVAELIRSKKQNKLLKIANNILSSPVPSFLKADGGKKHTSAGPAVFTAAFNRGFVNAYAKLFAQTLRNTGFKGDIVVGVHEDSR